MAPIPGGARRESNFISRPGSGNGVDGVVVPVGPSSLQPIVWCYQERRLTGLRELHCKDVPYGRSGLPCRQLPDKRWELLASVLGQGRAG